MTRHFLFAPQMQCSLALVPSGCLQLYACKNLGDFCCIRPENQEASYKIVDRDFLRGEHRGDARLRGSEPLGELRLGQPSVCAALLNRGGEPELDFNEL